MSRASPGRLAEHARERLAESAVGFESRVEAGIERRRALVQRAHRRPETARALVGLERHAEASLERAAHLHRVEPALAQIVIAQRDVGIASASRRRSGASQFGADAADDIGSQIRHGR